MPASPHDLRPLEQTGYTLVEILVAMVIGLFLMGGIIQLFIGTKQSYRVEDALSRIQENARFALDIIGQDARMTSYAGCVRLDNLQDQPMIAPGLSDANYAIANSKDNFIWGKKVVASDPDYASAIQDTDAMTLRLLSGETVKVDADMTANTGTISIEDNDWGFAANETLAIADCTSVDIFNADTVSGAAPTVIQPHTALSKPYLRYSDDEGTMIPGTVVMRFHRINYYIGDDAGTPTLFRQDNANAVPLIEGVEDMEILYGIDTNSDGAPDSYVAAATVGDWGQVVSLRISLLLASTASNLTEDAQIVTWRGADYPDPPDNRLRQIITTTIAIRNRLQ